MGLIYEPASELLHISGKWLRGFLAVRAEGVAPQLRSTLSAAHDRHREGKRDGGSASETGTGVRSLRSSLWVGGGRRGWGCEAPPSLSLSLSLSLSHTHSRARARASALFVGRGGTSPSVLSPGAHGVHLRQLQPMHPKPETVTPKPETRDCKPENPPPNFGKPGKSPPKSLTYEPASEPLHIFAKVVGGVPRRPC